MSGPMLVAAIIGAPFAGSLLIVALRGARGAAAAIGVISAIATAMLVAWCWATTAGTLLWQTTWIGAAGIGIGFQVDHLSLLFAVLVAGVSLFSLIYSLRYIPHELEHSDVASDETAYYAYMLAFTGAMLGTVFASDLIQLYVFWELTGVASFLLIGLNWQDRQARRGAVRALTVTALGGLAMLVGFIALGSTLGTFAIASILEAGDLLRAAPLFAPALVLIVVGAATKSAQFPFHIWLPTAMVAPTPVSAFLHSAALVAAGVYLLARFHPLFAGTDLWMWSVVSVSTASILVGGVLALRAREFKALLAYSTISQYGFIIALLGYATPTGYLAALFSFFQHGIAKAALFFVAGIVTYATGRKELGENGGLWSRLPFVFIVATILALSLSGLPGLAGFWMKELYLGATLTAGGLAAMLPAVAAGAITLAYMLRFLGGAFSGERPAPSRIASVPTSMLLAPVVAAVLAIALGVWPGLFNVLLAGPAAGVADDAPRLDLAVHLDVILALSLLSLGLGVVAFATYRRWSFLLEPLARKEWSLDALYAGGIRLLVRAGQAVLGLQSGFLHRYLLVVLLGLLGLIVWSGLPLLLATALPEPGGEAFITFRGLLQWEVALVLLLIVAGTVLTFTLRQHIHVILALSAVGYLIAGFFALELAPDVGLVQVHVETLVTVLFILALVLIPRKVRQPLVLDAWRRLSPSMLILAVVGGVGSAWLSWLAIEHVAADPIAPWFNDNAVELTHANDVVAAILIDFRALDTLGEITVFAIATAGVYALVRLILRQSP